MYNQRLHEHCFLVTFKRKLSKAVTCTFRLEYTLRYDESQSTGVWEVLINSRIDEEHRKVFFPATKPPRRPRKSEQSISLPQWLHPVAIVPRQAFPINPRWIPGHIIDLAHKQLQSYSL